MAKIALLIGISEHLPEFPALPSAVKDVEAMKEVLGNSEMGGFDEIEVLKDSNRQEIEEAIYGLFDDRNKNDILLFYFSGHGIKSRGGNLFFATPQTRKSQRGIVTPTAVGASFLQSQMNDSFSQRLVVILDCCYSGAFTKGMIAKGDENIDIQAELGGRGRAILMSSSSTQSSFQSEGSELSIYTKYLVEGIKTGAADTDGDGKISADDLHQYVSQKVREESPAMTPQFEPVREGYRIYLARAPQHDPQLEYRLKVQEILRQNNGNIDFLKEALLEEVRIGIGLSYEEAKLVEIGEKKPYVQFRNKLKRYKEIFSQAVEESYPLTENERKTLQEIQSYLGLRDEDVAPIEKQILPQLSEPIYEYVANTKVTETSSQNDEIELPSDQNVNTETSSQNDEIELPSDQNVNYENLRELLAAGEWKKADEETVRAMVECARQQQENLFGLGNRDLDDRVLSEHLITTYLVSESIKNFPRTDLQTIDKLWVKYSNGKFGFSVQKKIYRMLGGTKSYDEKIWEAFGHEVGWRREEEWSYYSDLTFDLNEARAGHLPGYLVFKQGVEGTSGWEFIYILSRRKL